MSDSVDAIVRRSRADEAIARQVVLSVDPSRLRYFEIELIQRLRAGGVGVSLHFGHTQWPLPASVELLLQIERLAYHLKSPLLAERISSGPVHPLLVSEAGRDDLVIDLCGAGDGDAGRTLRILYDGTAGEAALVAALLAGRMPAIEIQDTGANIIVARGIACADNAGTLSEALECVLARALVLVTAVVGGRRLLATPLARAPMRPRSVVAFELRALASAAVSRLYHLCCHAPHWRTLWRFVQDGDLWDTRTMQGTSWNVIPDPGHRFYADPFPYVHDGRTFVFVEDLDHRSGKGVISVMPFDQDGPTGPAQPVLEEPWHLSYPFLIEHEGEIWMVPESSADATVRLYRADPFPYRWVREATLLAGVEASDATITRHDGLFWMFAATRDGFGSWSDTLSLWWARDLRGPWNAHAGNPVLVDQSAARPAGAMVRRAGRLLRPVQDCTHGYGTGIGLAEVTTLDRERFEQRVDAILRAEPNWPGRRFHTLNRAGAIECIDGAAYSPRSRTLARWVQDWSGRREEPQPWH